MLQCAKEDSGQHLGVAGVAVAPVVVDVQLLVVVAVVGAGAAPRGERPDLRLGPGVVGVVEREGGHPGAVEVEGTERVAALLQLRHGVEVLVACPHKPNFKPEIINWRWISKIKFLLSYGFQKLNF